MENPLQLDMTDSPLFAVPTGMDENVMEQGAKTLGVEKGSGEADVLDMNASLLFQPPQESQIDDDFSSSDGTGKQVKLSNGKTITLKRKTNRQVDIEHTGLGQSDELSLMDMDLLFQKAKERQAIKENQRLLDQEATAVKTHKPTMVWTEKYRPKRYIQLCSAGNDRQYRMMSHWLRKWSSIVFHDYADEEDVETVDSFGRPLRKFLLINGPSGIGKTAAVHIIAKQLGYNVEELNAANSMDVLPNSNTSGGNLNNHNNVVSSLRLKIQNALTSNSIQTNGNKITSNGRPTCLVIDEIDTAGNSSDIIRVLHELNLSDQRALNKSYNNTNQYQDGKKTKSKKKDNLLNRPIICIANDAYSNNNRSYGGFNMDKLRSMSEIITFRKPAFQKTTSGVKSGGKALKSVKEFIKTISEQERLDLDYQEISEIVEICEGDIRACINHLQFSGRKPESLISDNLLLKLNKDAQLSWFRLTDMLFKRNPQLSKEDDFDQLMNIILDGSGKSASSSSGTLDKVIRGCFSRYLDAVHFQDDSLTKPCELSDWLDFYDRLGNNNEISHYSSLVNMKFWTLFSEINPQKVNKQLIPDIKSIEYESSEQKKLNKSIIKRFISNMPINLKLSIGGGFEDNDSFGLYFLPMVYKLLAPDMTSSGSSGSLLMKLKSALSEFDQRGLEKAASLFKDFGINLESLRDADTNQVTLEINPNIDALVLFDSEASSSSFDTIRKQIQLKRRWFFPMLKAELERLEMQHKTQKRKLDKLDSASATETIKDATKSDQKEKRQKASSSLDFFKGQYDGMSTQLQQPKEVPEVTRIWVKYNEGFSNAVRKTIGWNDLWIP